MVTGISDTITLQRTEFINQGFPAMISYQSLKLYNMTRITGYLLVIGLLMQAGLASGQTHDLNDNVWLSKISDKDVNYHQVVAEFEQYWSGKTPDRKSEYKFFRRWQDWAMASVHPDGTFKSPDHDLNVYEQFKMQNPGYKSSGYWEYQGPEPGPGRISALGFHPTNDNTLYVWDHRLEASGSQPTEAAVGLT
jgi:hypothetical protein